MKRHSVHSLTGLVAVLLLAGRVLHAEIPEPDTVLYGSIALGHQPVTADHTNVVVELRAAIDGEVLQTYRMGDDPVAGNFYLLRIKSESLGTVRESDAVALGDTVHLAVREGDETRDETTHTLTTRGRIVRLDFGDVDTDGDGMSDSFELTHFGSPTGGDPAADPDGDGRPNVREFLQATDPLTADGQHPADRSPADWAIDIREVTEYALAWKVGEDWPIEPVTIPIDYVTRASALWVTGEQYVFSNVPPTNAPQWWITAPTPPPSPALASAAANSQDTNTPALQLHTPAKSRAALHAATSSAASPAAASDSTRVLPPTYELDQPFQVTLTITPAAETRAFAVEEAPPSGWRVRAISSEGRLDTKRRLIKWGPFYGSEPRTVTYELTPLTVSTQRFEGTASFDGASIAIGGPATLRQNGVNEGPAPSLVVSSNPSGVRLDLGGAAANTRYSLESSTDLVNWSVIATTQTDAEGKAHVVVPATGDSAFFRLSSE